MVGFLFLVVLYVFTPFATYENQTVGVILYIISVIVFFIVLFYILDFLDDGSEPSQRSIKDNHRENSYRNNNQYSWMNKPKERYENPDHYDQNALDRKIYQEEMTYKNYVARQEQLASYQNDNQKTDNGCE
jgi:uncharacterized membrane protein